VNLISKLIIDISNVEGYFSYLYIESTQSVANDMLIFVHMSLKLIEIDIF